MTSSREATVPHQTRISYQSNTQFITLGCGASPTAAGISTVSSQGRGASFRRSACRRPDGGG